MSLMQRLFSQFHKPRGFLGRVAGWIMSGRGSNLERNVWTVNLLDIEPGNRVLELGPGPGVTLGLILEKLDTGKATAVDHSSLMLEFCRKRHPAEVSSGKLTLIESAFPGIPEGEKFDRIMGVNSLQFDAMNPDTLGQILGHLNPGGRMAISFQPRGQNPTDEQALAFADKAKDLLSECGLCNLRTERLDTRPTITVCILGEKPAD